MKITSFGLTSFLTNTAVRQAPEVVHDQLKRPFDLFVAAIGLLVAAPVLLVLAVIIKLTSKGPVFYVQERLGRGGKPFNMYKLRTMRVDAEKDGPKWCAQGDPRVTPVGRFLRKSHLDELPQLLNVLRSEMSLIGPRPERPCFVEQLKKDIPLYTARLAVRPGVTGLAQIKHRADQTIDDVQAKLGYDLEYIRRACLLLDLQIVALTAVKMVIGRSGTA